MSVAPIVLLQGTATTTFYIGKNTLIQANGPSVARTINLGSGNIDFSATSEYRFMATQDGSNWSPLPAFLLFSGALNYSSGAASSYVSGAREVALPSNLFNMFLEKVYVEVTSVFDGPNTSIFSMGTATNTTEYFQQGSADLTSTGVYEIKVLKPLSASINYIFFPDGATTGSINVYFSVISQSVNFTFA